jgi:hypothetical protein
MQAYRVVRRGGHHGSRSKPTRVEDKELLQFFAHVVTSLLLAGAHQCAARQSGRAQMRLRKRRCEPWCWACTITCIGVRSRGMPPRSSRAALRVGEDLAVTSGAVSSTGTLWAR